MTYLTERNAFALGVLGIGTRVYQAGLIDGAHLYNAGWVSALAACLISFPLAFCLTGLERRISIPAPQMMTGIWHRFYCLIVCLFCIYETGCTLTLFAISTEHVSLNGFPIWALIMLIMLSVFVICLNATDAVGGIAYILFVLFVLYLGLSFVARFPSLNPRWLHPVFGPGVNKMVGSTVTMSGILTGIVPLWLAKSRGAPDKRSRAMPSIVLFIMIWVVLLMLTQSMLSPAMPFGPTSRSFLTQQLISNGRIPLTFQVLQLPLYCATSILIVLFSLFGAQRTLIIAMPRLPESVAAGICLLACLIVPWLDLHSRIWIDFFNALRLCLISLPVFLYIIVQSIRKRRGNT